MKYLFILILFSALGANAQCKSGDCENGQGSYDFGWCHYTGSFKNGKPEGKGIMKYDDYTYDGTFKNGIEDGQGVITYKNGKKEVVYYKAGTKIKADEKVSSSEWKTLEGQSDDCLKGNCITGFGTVLFPSGNKYEGNFLNRKKQGQGTFYFTNGDRFEGSFAADLKEKGLYTFSNGYTYQGNFLNDEFYTGVFRAPSGNLVRLNNGKVILPTVRNSGTADQRALSCPATISCPHCHGKGIESKPIEQRLSWSTKDSYAVDRYGNRTLTSAGQSGGGNYSIPNYVSCSRCGGKGLICKS